MIVLCKYDELVDIDKLKPNPENNNKHSKEQLQRLARIIDHNGWTSPITVSTRTGKISKGHARLYAARINKYEKAPVQYIDYRDEAHEYADLTADNEIARWAELDTKLVFEKIKSFDDFDIEILGIQEFSIADMIDEDLEELSKDEETPKLNLFIKFNNEMDMMDLYDDLVSKGYAVERK